MNLLQIRQWFVNESGRFDLVVDAASDNWTDKGANAYINAGQRMLDRMQETPKTLGRNFQMVSAGYYHVLFQDCRAIKEVWAVNAATGRKKLEKKDMSWLRGYYNNMVTIERGAPVYYAPARLRTAPELHSSVMSTLTGLLAYMDVSVTSHYLYNGILFLPPVDSDYMIETWGNFYSTQLVADTDESHWSVQHPELLVMAAQCVLEKFRRNTEGVKDWIASIKMHLQEIDFDLAEEDMTDITQMEG